MAMLFGYIFTWDGFEGSDTDGPAETFFQAVAQLRNFKPISDARKPAHNRWRKVRFESQVPLLGEEPGFVQSTWFYPVHLRVNNSTGTVIIAASRYTITDAVVQAFNYKVTPNVRRKVVNIEEVSDHLLTPTPQKFAITYYMADVPGYGTALNTISLHGDDIAAASFLSQERQNFTARQVGVRPVDQRGECGRFSNTGQIQFREENLEGLERFLRYAYENGFYID